MKKRKTFVGMTIFIAILVLGVGYASISDVTLNLTGTANVQANAEFRVEYDTLHTVKVSPDTEMTWDAETSEVRDVVTGSYTDASNATMTVNLDSTNRSASAVYKIVNSSAELSANITGSVVSEEFTSENAEYLLATPELYTDEECTTPLTDSVLESGEVAYLKVTVSLKKLPVDTIVGATFTVTTTAEPVAVELAD